jgi:hypothetical protein
MNSKAQRFHAKDAKSIRKGRKMVNRFSPSVALILAFR